MQTVHLNSPTEQTHVVPSKIVCIGRNYVEHIHELANEMPDELVVFFKPNSAISNHLSAKHLGESLHYEAELCFMFHKGRFGAVALGLDLTKRQTQGVLKSKGLPWERAKAFDGSAIFSDFIPIERETIEQLNLSLTINTQLTQQGGVSLMMVKPDEILHELQKFITLEDGDIVMTGTPKGVGMINEGDIFSGSVYISDSEKPLLSNQWKAQ
jgi:2-keto-4-pentenoate hydratase/2-oxohepta-3-ene-1,7-dioic acid hydratase in catechol pathway